MNELTRRERDIWLSDYDSNEENIMEDKRGEYIVEMFDGMARKIYLPRELTENYEKNN